MPTPSGTSFQHASSSHLTQPITSTQPVEGIEFVGFIVACHTEKLSISVRIRIRELLSTKIRITHQLLQTDNNVDNRFYIDIYI